MQWSENAQKSKLFSAKGASFKLFVADFDNIPFGSSK
jgi:hypothetical protein